MKQRPMLQAVHMKSVVLCSLVRFAGSIWRSPIGVEFALIASNDRVLRMALHIENPCCFTRSLKWHEGAVHHAWMLLLRVYLVHAVSVGLKVLVLPAPFLHDDSQKLSACAVLRTIRLSTREDATLPSTTKNHRLHWLPIISICIYIYIYTFALCSHFLHRFQV